MSKLDCNQAAPQTQNQNMSFHFDNTTFNGRNPPAIHLMAQLMLLFSGIIESLQRSETVNHLSMSSSAIQRLAFQPIKQTHSSWHFANNMHGRSKPLLTQKMLSKTEDKEEDKKKHQHQWLQQLAPPPHHQSTRLLILPPCRCR